MTEPFQLDSCMTETFTHDMGIKKHEAFLNLGAAPKFKFIERMIDWLQNSKKLHSVTPSGNSSLAHVFIYS